MEHKPVEKKFYSRFANYSTTFKGDKRIRIQFKNHYYATNDKEIIDLIEADIARAKKLGSVSSIMTIDEEALLKAQEVQYVVIEGKKVSSEEIISNALEVEELKKQLQEIKKKENKK
jgi:hypothetical protein